MKEVHSNRRRFLAALAGVTGGSWLALHAPAILAAGEAAALQQEADAPLARLTPAEALTLGAVAEQIIPADDLPGAVEIGVVYFIDNVLGDFMAGAAGLLQQGAADLDRAASQRCPACGGFADLPFEEQTALLETIEETPFFNTMISLTHCGVFAAPSWGGNRDKAGWALLDFQDRHGWQPPFGYYDAILQESGRDS